MSVSLFVQNSLPHFMQTVFLSNPLSTDVAWLSAVFLFGKLMAFLWQSGSHAVQPFMHLKGYATKAFPSWNVKTPFGQKSTQRGFPNLTQPSHFSGKIVGYQTPHTLVINFHFSNSLLQSKQYSVSKFAWKILPHRLHLTSLSVPFLIGEVALNMSMAAWLQGHEGLASTSFFAIVIIYRDPVNVP